MTQDCQAIMSPLCDVNDDHVKPQHMCHEVVKGSLGSFSREVYTKRAH